MSNSWRRTLPCIIVGAILWALGGCGDGDPAVTASGAPSPGETSTSAPGGPSATTSGETSVPPSPASAVSSVVSSVPPSETTVPPASSAGGLSGVVIRRSDVASDPHRLITAGAVVIVPDDAVVSFWAAVGLPASGPPVLGKSEFLVDPSSMPAGVEVAVIADGRFTSGASGAVLLCLADDLAGDQQGPPYRVNGCARFTGAGEVRLSSGLGGVRADLA